MKSTAIAEKTASTNLVTISKNEIAGELVQSVNARDLHGRLGSKRQFGNWIKDKLGKYGFIEGVDYITNLLNRSDGKIGKGKTDYILTLDTAKEIAMVENNEMGRKIRRYFIEVEKKAREETKNITTIDIINHIKYLQGSAELLVEAVKGASLKSKQDEIIIQRQIQEIKELKANNNKLKALQTNISQLGQAELLMSVEEAGMKLGIARNTLFRKMRAKRFLKLNNEPYKRFKGEYFIQKKVTHGSKNGPSTYMQTFILPKGLELLKQAFA